MTRTDFKTSQDLEDNHQIVPWEPSPVLSSTVSVQQNKTQFLLLESHSGIKEIKEIPQNHSVILPEVRVWTTDLRVHME